MRTEAVHVVHATLLLSTRCHPLSFTSSTLPSVSIDICVDWRAEPTDGALAPDFANAVHHQLHGLKFAQGVQRRTQTLASTQNARANVNSRKSTAGRLWRNPPRVPKRRRNRCQPLPTAVDGRRPLWLSTKHVDEDYGESHGFTGSAAASVGVRSASASLAGHAFLAAYNCQSSESASFQLESQVFLSWLFLVSWSFKLRSRLPSPRARAVNGICLFSFLLRNDLQAARSNNYSSSPSRRHPWHALGPGRRQAMHRCTLEKLKSRSSLQWPRLPPVLDTPTLKTHPARPASCLSSNVFAQLVCVAEMSLPCL